MRAKIISRENIENQKIIHVYQTAWETHFGVSACSVFIELSNNVIFELQSSEDSEISDASDKKNKLIPVEWYPGTKSCEGECIKTLLTSELWPSIGILLSSNRVLYISSWGPGRVGPLLAEVDEVDEMEILTFWERKPVISVEGNH
jgi:hypothetical protein